ncbi:phage terminase large subunit family protein [Rouxiella sp. S1S-2]|uniref:phage terminase large subunit family protein n=1 Tax=Rouxiella sp. S1S-2 TaxID=2653856 RepID=UPI0012654E26|nr:phage terminase large subunit family protein [Rouxiella sp. S1S-2]KAB7896001.1 phage terminase large subunit family protein [Rouxiella sp. S1S-2]
MSNDPYASASAIRRDVSALLKAPRRMPVADAVSKFMRVPDGGGSSSPWDAALTPYIIEPMNCLASRSFDTVVFVGPARTGKTIGLIDGWIVYTIVCDPSDFLLIQMTEEKAREHSKKRLDRTFRVSKAVKKRLSPRTNDNNVHDKTFRAGNYLKIGWPSINIMSSSDYKFVALTDYDRWPDDVDGEGDGYTIASKRNTTFMSSGMTLVESSPGREIVDGKWRRKSLHEAPPTTGILSLYNLGDRRRWYWPCPQCSEYFQPEMAAMTGYRDIADPVKASEAAMVECPHCHLQIKPKEKRQLNQQGVWLREGETIDKQGRRGGEPRHSRIASFWMEGPAAAYQTWAQMVYKLLCAEQVFETTGSEQTLRAIINTDWGRPYLPKAAGEQRRSDELMARAKDYGKRLVPVEVRFLMAAVDVQAGKNRRFVVQIIGYGEQGERWLIDRYNIKQSLRCDDAGESLPIHPGAFAEDWDLLISDVLNKSYRLADDDEKRMPVLAMAVDTGGEDGVTDNAYKFWRRCRKNGCHKRVYLVKGDSNRRQKSVTKTYPDNSERSDRRADARGDVPVYLLQTDIFKDQLKNSLDRDVPGTGFIHFPAWIGEWFYDELTYEERGLDGKWSKPGKGANEAMDLFCYVHAIAFLRGYERIKWEKPPAWAEIQSLNPNVFTENASGDPHIVTTQNRKQSSDPAPAKQASSGASGWLTGGSGGGQGWLS